MKIISFARLLVCSSALLIACTETRNLAEGEQLYTGIKELAYDRKMTRPAADDSAGVITAVANAYEAVADMLSADEKRPLTKAEKEQQERDREAYAEAKAQVEGVLAKAPNNSLLGSSYHRFPLPFGLWVYNKYVDRQGRWARWMLNTFGANPVYVTTVNPKVRVQVAQNTLRNHGYFRATADYLTLTQGNPRKAKISYEVHPGDLFRLDTIEYQRFPHVADSLIRAHADEALIRQGDPFNVVNLNGERTRLSNLLRNHGYYYYQPAYVTFRADTLMRPLNVQVQVRPAADVPQQAQRQYRIGRTRLNILNSDARAATDTVVWRNLTLGYTPDAKGRVPLKPRTMFRYMTHRKGQLYSVDQMQKVQSDLAAMGVFSMLSVECVPHDTLDSDTLDVLITARLDKPYDAEFKGSVATKSNGLLGPGLGFSMTRQNAFRGAEKVSLDLNGSYEWMTGANTQGSGQAINSYEYGAALNLQFPRLTALGLAHRMNRRAKTSTTYKIDANWMNRSAYFGRVTFGARIMYSYQRREGIKHELVPFRLDYNMMLSTTAKFDSIIDRNQALYVSMRDQFVPSMQYTLSTRGFTLTAKEAGNLTSALYRAGGRSFTEQGKNLFGVPFAQYVRLTAELTRDWPLGSTAARLVAHLFAGAVVSYGNSTTAPYNDLFAIGGANSIRAFSIRSIGPGSRSPAASAYSYIDAMGDTKVEANVECRFPLMGSLHGAVFVDAGNVWNRSEMSASTLGREIALGTGLGVRYDLEFLIVRFDVGVGLHAPYDTGRAGYYNMTSFGNSLGYHIAIGYPF